MSAVIAVRADPGAQPPGLGHQLLSRHRIDIVVHAVHCR
jgi:hypothetical protein